MVSLSENEFCIKCGVLNHRMTQSDCVHVFKKPKEFFIPSINLYGKENIDWVLYTVDNTELTVYIDSPDFTGPRQKVGTGGIVLRNLRLVFDNCLLNDMKIFTIIKEKLQITDDKKIKEIIRLLSFLEELYRNNGMYTLSELEIGKEKYPALKLEDSPFMKFVDLTGTIKFIEILKNVYAHGQWGARNLES